MGNNAPKDAFRLDALDIGTDLLGARLAWLHAMVVIGSWFLCREIELSALRVKHMVLDAENKQVGLTLSASKTDTVGSMVQRRHSCYCGTVPETICPTMRRFASLTAAPTTRRPSSSPAGQASLSPKPR